MLGVLKRQISNLAAYFLASKSHYCKCAILRTLRDGVYRRVAIPVIDGHSQNHL